jgi:hypothetical protein
MAKTNQNMFCKPAQAQSSATDVGGMALSVTAESLGEGL